MGKFIDLTGQKYGKLTVISRSKDYISPKGYIAVNWKCKCDCGKIIIIRGCNLKSGATRSCGCEKVLHPNRTTHGGTNTRLYKIWKHMRTRCKNPNDLTYNDYGGRGITICNEWDDFEEFRNWSLEHGYTDDLSIDRVDYNGNYCPDNCRWTDALTQANNTRRNHLITCNGETRTMAEWARITGISYHKLKDRLNKCKWSAEKALTTQ